MSTGFTVAECIGEPITDGLAKVKASQGANILRLNWQGQGAGAWRYSDCLGPVCSSVAESIGRGPVVTFIPDDLELSRRLASKFIARVEGRNPARPVNAATRADVEAAGAAAVVAWRSGQGMDGQEHGASGVAWRALSNEFNRAQWGSEWETLDGPEVGEVADDKETRAARVGRWLQERRRARRPRLLGRVESSAVASVGQAAAAAGRRQTGASLAKRSKSARKAFRVVGRILAGETLDAAAVAEGYKGGGGAGHLVRPGDRVAEALRRLRLGGGWTQVAGERPAEVRRWIGQGAASVAVALPAPPSLFVRALQAARSTRGRLAFRVNARLVPCVRFIAPCPPSLLLGAEYFGRAWACVGTVGCTDLAPPASMVRPGQIQPAARPKVAWVASSTSICAACGPLLVRRDYWTAVPSGLQAAQWSVAAGTVAGSAVGARVADSWARRPAGLVSDLVSAVACKLLVRDESGSELLGRGTRPGLRCTSSGRRLTWAHDAQQV